MESPDLEDDCVCGMCESCMDLQREAEEDQQLEVAEMAELLDWAREHPEAAEFETEDEL